MIQLHVLVKDSVKTYNGTCNYKVSNDGTLIITDFNNKDVAVFARGYWLTAYRS